MPQPNDSQFPPPVIALLTDFGSLDHYGGVVKGVIASISPLATVVDITHEVEPHKVKQAAYLLWASYRFFPAHSVFVSIVDPAVGSDRKILVGRTNKYFFLAPDNGVMDLVRAEDELCECYEVRTKKSPFVFSPVSSTFHGRDVFAPVAAYLANGVACSEFGPVHKMSPVESPFITSRDLRAGEILHCDRFGNLVTNIKNSLFESVGKIKTKKSAITEKLKYYGEGKKNTPGLIQGSSGLIEIVIREGNASQRLGISPETPFKIEWQ